MNLVAACLSRKMRPRAPQSVQPDAARIDQVGRFAHGPAKAALRLGNHGREQTAEYRARALGVGVRQGRTRYRAGADVIKPYGMAFQAPNDFPQTGCPGKLAVKQRDELALGRQTTVAVIRLVIRDQTIEFAPRNPLQQIVENAIVVPQGVASVFVSEERANVRTQVESTPCTQSTKSKPDSRGSSPRMTGSIRATFPANPRRTLKISAFIRVTWGRSAALTSGRTTSDQSSFSSEAT